MSTFQGPTRAGGKKEDESVGDVVITQSATLAYTDTTAKNLFRIPKPYRILDLVIDVSTAFNSSGTDLVDIGITGTGEQFAADVDVSSTGRKTAIQAAKLANLVNSTDDDGYHQVIGQYAQSVADASAGAARITISYVHSKSRDT